MNPDHEDDVTAHVPDDVDPPVPGAGASDVLVWTEAEDPDRLTDGAGHLLDLVAAVDHLGRGLRHRFTVWDALEEALRWWNAEQHHVHHQGPAPNSTDGPAWAEPDPLHATLRRFLYLLDSPDSPPAAVALQQAIRRWTATMAEAYNRSYAWPHPSGRQSFPAAQLVLDDGDELESSWHS